MFSVLALLEMGFWFVLYFTISFALVAWVTDCKWNEDANHPIVRLSGILLNIAIYLFAAPTILAIFAGGLLLALLARRR